MAEIKKTTTPDMHIQDQKHQINTELINIIKFRHFTEKEVESCTQSKFKNVSLGKTRLRAETAGILACHTFSIANM